MRMRLLYLLAACFSAIALSAYAADWPGFRGPLRTDVSEETGLLKTWPKDGPPLLWTYSEAGTGYSGPAIVGGKLYTMGARDKTEYVICLDTKTGKQVWAGVIGPRFDEGHGNGPRGTPTVDGNLLYAMGGQGELVCLDVAKGAKKWSKNMKKDFKGEMMSGWGYCESPLVDGDNVICCPGGAGGTMVAFEKKTGKQVWRSTALKDKASYSSAIVAELGGIRQYITLTGQAVVGIAAKDGRLLWRVPQDRFKTAVISTVIFHDDHVFASSGYGYGCVLVKLTASGDTTKAEQVYANKDMTNHHGGVVLVGEHLYGYSDGKGWICQEFKTGKTVWDEKGKLGKGSLTCADGKLYCYSEKDGTIVLADASTTGWKENSRFTIPKTPSKSGQVWTHPVVCDGRLYLRDQEVIFCYDLKATSAAAPGELKDGVAKR